MSICPRSIQTPSGALSLAMTLALGLLLTSPAAALLMPGPLVYHEDYLGSSFPTTPSTDLISAGESLPFAVGNGAGNPVLVPPSFAYTGLGAVSGVHSDEQSGAVALSSALGLADVGVRGGFRDFEIALNGDGRGGANVFAGFVDVTVAASFAYQRIGGVEDYVIAVVETGLGGQTSTLANLSIAEGLAILAGTEFQIDLVVNRTSGLAQAEIVVAGFGPTTTGALALTQTAATHSAAGQGASLANVDLLFGGNFNTDDTLILGFDSFSIYSPVPEPSTALLVAVGLAGLAVQGRRR